MNTDKCTKISPADRDFKAIFYTNFKSLWIKENAPVLGHCGYN